MQVPNRLEEKNSGKVWHVFVQYSNVDLYIHVIYSKICIICLAVTPVFVNIWMQLSMWIVHDNFSRLSSKASVDRSFQCWFIYIHFWFNNIFHWSYCNSRIYTTIWMRYSKWIVLANFFWLKLLSASINHSSVEFYIHIFIKIYILIFCCNSRIYVSIWMWLNMWLLRTNVSRLSSMTSFVHQPDLK